MLLDTSTLVSSSQQTYEASRLRPAAFKDLAKLVDLYNAARDRGSESRASMSDWLEHGGALLLENAQGEMLCALRWREDPSGWRVDRIATHPDARGRGYGRWLMTKLEALAIRRNIPTLTLVLDDAQAELLGYYRRMGYQVSEQDAYSATLSKRVGGVWQYKL